VAGFNSPREMADTRDFNGMVKKRCRLSLHHDLKY
jgi:hypothetical protein